MKLIKIISSIPKFLKKSLFEIAQREYFVHTESN